jgi:hypothetical protein
MTTKNEYLAVALAELAKFDVAPRISNGGKHSRVEWKVDGGPRRVTTIPGSPSDVRGLLNLRSKIRRTLREDGAKPRDSMRRAAQQIIAVPVPVEPLTNRVERLEREVADLQDLIVELMTPAREADAAAPAAPKSKCGKMAELLQHMFYDRPQSIKQLVEASGQPYSIVASRLHGLKGRGLAKQLAGHGGAWLKAPIP